MAFRKKERRKNDAVKEQRCRSDDTFESLRLSMPFFPDDTSPVLPTKPQHEVLYEIAVAERQRARADSERAGRVAAEATTVAASQTAARAKQVATQTKQETRKATARVEEANTVRKRLQKQLSTTEQQRIR